MRRNEVIYLLDMYLTFEKDKLLLYMITKSLVRAKKNRYNLYNSYGEVISIFNVEYNPDLKRFEAKLLSQGNQDAGL